MLTLEYYTAVNRALRTLCSLRDPDRPGPVLPVSTTGSVWKGDINVASCIGDM